MNYPTTSNMNNSVSISTDIYPKSVHYTLNTLYVLVTLCGLTGSGLVCLLFARKKVKHTSFNLLLLNLSIADIMADLSSYPYVFIDLVNLRKFPQKGANIGCTFTMGQTPFWIATVVSLFTLTYISITRYIAIAHPHKASWFRKKRSSVCFMGIIWPLAFAILLPNFFSFQFDPVYALCYRKWPDGFSGKLYGLMTSLIGFAAPAAVMIFTFCSTATKLWGSKVLKQKGLRKRRKVIFLLGCLILAFLICWGPFFVYWILSTSTGEKIFPGGPEGQIQRMRVIRVVVLLALTNTLADPLIYGLRSREFRKAFMETFGKTMSSRGTSEFSSSEDSIHGRHRITLIDMRNRISKVVRNHSRSKKRSRKQISFKSVDTERPENLQATGNEEVRHIQNDNETVQVGNESNASQS